MLYKNSAFIWLFAIYLLSAQFSQIFSQTSSENFAQCKLKISERAENLFENLDKLYFETVSKHLQCKHLKTISKLTETEQEMFEQGIAEVQKLSLMQTNPAQYMQVLIEKAAELSIENSGKASLPISSRVFPSRRKSSAEENANLLFVHLIGIVFPHRTSGNFNGYYIKLGRFFFRISSHQTGEILEDIYEKKSEEYFLKIKLDEKLSNDEKAAKLNLGFNRNVLDREFDKNTVTHHFREFLILGYSKGKFWGNFTANFIDDFDKNPGDVKSAYFAVMLGDALRKNKISVREATDLIVWAFIESDKSKPFWSNFKRDYNIEKWKENFRDLK